MPDLPPSGPLTRCVFVYGTLRRGGTNDITRLQPPPVWLGAASIPGVLYHLGEYPGVRLGGSALVQGEVYRITPALEALLDRIEAIGPGPEDEYCKREVAVLVQGQWRPCLVYEAAQWRCDGMPQIPSGDWFRR